MRINLENPEEIRNYTNFVFPDDGEEQENEGEAFGFIATASDSVKLDEEGKGFGLFIGGSGSSGETDKNRILEFADIVNDDNYDAVEEEEE